MKFNAGFIYVAPNCDPKQQNAVIPGESIDLYVYGCSTYSQAEVVAKSLVEEKGCTAIELCAGFGNDRHCAYSEGCRPGCRSRSGEV